MFLLGAGLGVAAVIAFEFGVVAFVSPALPVGAVSLWAVSRDFFVRALSPRLRTVASPPLLSPEPEPDAEFAVLAFPPVGLDPLAASFAALAFCGESDAA